MQKLQTFKFELRPRGQQKQQMRFYAGACRSVYNKALALQKERYERGENVDSRITPIWSARLISSLAG
jgi:putative transposase